MASYRGHLAFSASLGVGYGLASYWYLELDWVHALLAAGLTTVSGLLPDLDSDSGVPVRVLFGLLSLVVPLLLLPRLLAMDLTLVQVLLTLAGCHLLVRYGASALFKRVTVHRGMYHSLPAMLIAGLAVFLLYHHPKLAVRFFLACGAMLGFLSHLVLDELCSVDFNGVKVSLNQFAGSALKFFSPSWTATFATYALLAVLVYCAALEVEGPRGDLHQWQQKTMRIGSPFAK